MTGGFSAQYGNSLWSVRLKTLLPTWLPRVRNRYGLTPTIEAQILKISARQIDRRLKDHKRQAKRRLYGRTKPGTLLKHQIPIKTEHWDVKTPGFGEVDLVSHSGNNADGDFIHSLNLTDIKTTWVETRAVMGKGQTGVIAAIDDIRGNLPFALVGVDSDNGSEFVNHHLLRYCREREIQLTRGRPYKKDDNAHIEQKNWTHVRKLLGYVRYDTEAALTAINDLYKGDLRLLQNLFLPSVKLLRSAQPALGARNESARRSGATTTRHELHSSASWNAPGSIRPWSPCSNDCGINWIHSLSLPQWTTRSNGSMSWPPPAGHPRIPFPSRVGIPGPWTLTPLPRAWKSYAGTTDSRHSFPTPAWKTANGSGFPQWLGKRFAFPAAPTALFAVGYLFQATTPLLSGNLFKWLDRMSQVNPAVRPPRRARDGLRP